MKIFQLLLLICVLSGSLSQGTDDKNEKPFVPHLTEAQFNQQVRLNPDQNWFIIFYTQWCPHCKRLKPVWKELANDLQGRVQIAAVDCEVESALRDRLVIAGYPTLLFFSKGRVYEYQEERALEKLRQYALVGYTEQESEEIPGQSETLNRYIKLFKISFNQLLRTIEANPLFGVVVVLILIGSLFGSYYLSDYILNKAAPVSSTNQSARTINKGNSVQEEKTIADSPERRSSPGRSKAKRE